MIRKLRVGVAGLGFGAAVHVPVFSALPDVEVVAIAGSSLAKAQDVARRLGIQQACDGASDLIGRDIDVVTLALPPLANEKALDLALARGLNILVEKPIATTADAAARLVGQATDRITAVNFIFGELGTFQMLRHLIADGSLGEIQHVSLDWRVRSFAYRNKIWSWKTDAARGGGVMTALGQHALYLVEWLFGPVTILQSQLENVLTSSFAPQGEVAAVDTAHITLAILGGVPVNMMLANASEDDPVHRWTVQGAHATAILENAGADYVANFRLLRDGVEIARERFGGGDGRVAAFASLARRFIASVRSRMPFTPALDTGARVQILMAQIEAAK
jgi:predicted dehydrogenase